MMEWTGSSEEVQSAIGQIEAGAVNYRELRELAGVLKVEIPNSISKPNLSALLLESLRKSPPPDPEASSSPESAPEPGPEPARDPALSLKPAELLLDEDLDVVEVYAKGETKPAHARRLGGVRGVAAMKVVRDVKSLAEADGYVVKRQMRRISGADYGL